MRCLLQVAPSTYIGGPMTALGYGYTKSKGMAISFPSLSEAIDWVMVNDRAAEIVNADTLEVIMESAS